MSSDQWDAGEVVRVKMKLAGDREAWSARMPRLDAERWLASAADIDSGVMAIDPAAAPVV